MRVWARESAALAHRKSLNADWMQIVQILQVDQQVPAEIRSVVEDRPGKWSKCF